MNNNKNNDLLVLHVLWTIKTINPIGVCYCNFQKQQFRWLLKLFIITNFLFTNGKKFPVLNKALTFHVNGDILKTLPEVCGAEKINLAILTDRKIALTGYFHNSTLENILKLILDEDMEWEYTQSFLIIRDKKPILKTYFISIPLEEEEKKEIDKFLKEFSEKKKNMYYIFNKEEGTVLFYGYMSDQKIIKEYIQHINNYYGKQVYLECKIITIRTSDREQKLDLIDIISGLISIVNLPNNPNNPKNKLTNSVLDNQVIVNQTEKNIDKMRLILGYLQDKYEITNVQELHLTLRNRSNNKFQNLETRYLDKIYDSKMLPINDVENKMKATVLKNVKELKAGIRLTIKTQIEDEKVFLKLDYEQSTFKDKRENHIPEIVENSFSATVQLNYEEIIALNGLKIYMKDNRQQNNRSKFFLWNWLFGRTQQEESKCQIIFLIRVKK